MREIRLSVANDVIQLTTHCYLGDNKMIQHKIQPVYDRNSRILILGSFPSVKSREGGFFYHHPQNRFWKVLSAVANDTLPTTIEEKKKFLLSHGIAVYDVIGSCDIVGSSDSSIANVVPSDIKTIIEKTGISKIYLNGNKAFELYEKYQKKELEAEGIQVEAIKLPSTSPANASNSLEKLIEQWSVMKKEIYIPLKPLDQELFDALLNWYYHNARILPWREEPTPYRVWISEIMLQQTRVEAVKPYYDRFMEALPTIEDLANVEDEVLMKLWEGLGYYNRARNLKKAANIVMEEYDGVMPADYEQLLALPGIGEYTAGAIGSIAYGLDVPAVDGNVLRVITRVMEWYEDILKQKTKKELTEKLKDALIKGKSGDINQALMELGATVCIPNGKPHCEECPWDTRCLAYKKDKITELPVKTPKKERRKEKKTVFLLEYEGKVAIQKRGEKGLLSGLWEFPNEEGYLEQQEMEAWLQKKGITKYQMEEEYRGKHIFSHVEWQMKGIKILIEERAKSSTFTEQKKRDFVWISKEEMERDYAIPSAFEWIKKNV